MTFLLLRKSIFAFDSVENKSAVSDYKINLFGNTGMSKLVVLEIQLMQDFLMVCFPITYPLNYSTATQSRY